MEKTLFVALIKKLVEGQTVQCQTYWEDDDGYRSIGKSTLDFYKLLSGREVTIDDFWINTGGYADGRATANKQLINDIVENLTKDYDSKQS